MRIGLLTGGGDCPGLNALIRAVAKQSALNGDTLVGFRHGWRGVVDGDAFPLTRDHVRGVLPLGGTMLGTTRFHPHENNGGIDAVLETLKHEHIGALICVGGDGTRSRRVSLKGQSRRTSLPSPSQSSNHGLRASQGAPGATSTPSQRIRPSAATAPIRPTRPPDGDDAPPPPHPGSRP